MNDGLQTIISAPAPSILPESEKKSEEKSSGEGASSQKESSDLRKLSIAILGGAIEGAIASILKTLRPENLIIVITKVKEGYIRIFINSRL